MAAVSNRVTPRSIARWTAWTSSRSSTAPYWLPPISQQPKPMADTLSSELPILRYCTLPPPVVARTLVPSSDHCIAQARGMQRRPKFFKGPVLIAIRADASAREVRECFLRGSARQPLHRRPRLRHPHGGIDHVDSPHGQ